MNDNIKKVLDIFRGISDVPRCSKNEDAVGGWILDYAAGKGFEGRRDSAGNVLISVPPSKGAETASAVILQGHMDMVCEKNPGSPHDFEKDPIKFIFDGDVLKADGTTLGADNGIAMALALAIAEDPTAIHPALELLFTTDEETGLNGASGLAEGLLKGKVLINIDSETEGVFTIGCAGGRHAVMTVKPETEAVTADMSAVSVKVSGLRGGHSGMDIDKGRGNANKIMAELLHSLKGTDIKFSALYGGTAHNAIPRDATAVLLVGRALAAKVSEQLLSAAENIKSRFLKSEPGLSILLTSDAAAPAETAVTSEVTSRIIDLVYETANGVYARDDETGTVQTSDNIATIRLAREGFSMLVSMRSSSASKLEELTSELKGVSEQNGALFTTSGGYPPWEPDWDSELLRIARKTYSDIFSVEPRVKVIHAGLECGIIGGKYPGLEMISLGPDIRNPHSPDELIIIPSIGKVYHLLKALLAAYAK